MVFDKATSKDHVLWFPFVFFFNTEVSFFFFSRCQVAIVRQVYQSFINRVTMIEQLDFLTLYKIRDFYLLWSSPDSLLCLWNQKPGDSFLLFEFAQTHFIKEVSVVYVVWSHGLHFLTKS